MITTNINEYLNTRPANYNRVNYDLFLHEVGGVKLKNAIYLTGTNGKGSTAFFLYEALRAVKLSVAIFSSPHFLHYNELALINDVFISDEVISSYINKYDDLFNKYTLSNFEIMTFISLHYFATLELDYVIVEAGLGVLIDATNIFTPLISVITNIKNDHLKELGPTLLDVAHHKAAIIHPHVPLFVGLLEGEVKDYIYHKADTLDAPLFVTLHPQKIVVNRNNTITFSVSNSSFTIRTNAKYETINASLAFTILASLQTKDARITKAAMQAGFLQMALPGRFTLVNKAPQIIVDGAHNPHAIMEVINNVKALKHAHLFIVFAAFRDKDIQSELDLLALTKADVVLTTFPHPRAATSYEESSFPFIADFILAIKHQQTKMEKDDILLIIGSLYFARLVLQQLRGDHYE